MAAEAHAMDVEEEHIGVDADSQRSRRVSPHWTAPAPRPCERCPERGAVTYDDCDARRGDGRTDGRLCRPAATGVRCYRCQARCASGRQASKSMPAVPAAAAMSAVEHAKALFDDMLVRVGKAADASIVVFNNRMVRVIAVAERRDVASLYDTSEERLGKFELNEVLKETEPAPLPVLQDGDKAGFQFSVAHIPARRGGRWKCS